MSNTHTQNVDSFGHLVDRLIVENLKLADFVRRLEIATEEDSTEENLREVKSLYTKLRLANESRSACKNALDKLLSDVVRAGDYSVLEEMRTFSLPGDVKENNPLRLRTPDSDPHDSVAGMLKRDPENDNA